MNSLQDRLVQEAARVREFLQAEGAAASEFLKDFPAGTCGHASDMLGEWLQELQFPDVEHVRGWRGTQSHAWIECSEYLVDITSDQFPDGAGEVYVGPMTDFHKSFNDQQRRAPQVHDMLRSVYCSMQQKL